MATYEVKRILYTAYGNRTGLIDVLVQVYDEGSTQKVTNGVMTEIGATGRYYYDYTPVSSGWHTWTADSATEPAPDQGIWLSESSETTTSDATPTATTYGTTLELARFLNIEEKIPSIKVSGSARSRENIGTGDGSNTLFYLDHGYILASSYTFYYGSSESASLSTPLTETTHYVLDKNNGELKLTAAGVTLVSTNNIYAEYSYCSLEITDTILQDALNRAQSTIDEETITHFADGTDATPDYTQVTNEKHSGRGRYYRDYFTRYYPLPDISTTLNGDVETTDTTITVDSTNGFPSTGYILIDGDKITYTGKTTTTFTGCTGIDAAHSDGDSVSPYIIELSTTSRGTTPTFTVLTENEDYDIDFESGKIHIYETDVLLDSYTRSYPPENVPNRFRVTYIYGYNYIPQDIQRLTLMIASKDLVHSIFRRSLISGRSNERIENIDIDENWIEKTLMRYKNLNATNV